MISAIIIDDQRINAEMLEQLIAQFCPDVTVSAACTTIEEGYMLISKHRPDVVFLDVELGDDDTGFDLLKMFEPVFFKIIFTTAHSRYAVDAFRENAADYLLKPIDVRQLQVAVARVAAAQMMEETTQSPDRPAPGARISLPTQEGYLFVQQDKIRYCEGSGSYTNFYFADDRKITVSMNLKECEALLPADLFCRIHNSYIVNICCIARYIRGRVGTVVLNNNVQLEVSASRKDTFLQLMKKV